MLSNHAVILKIDSTLGEATQPRHWYTPECSYHIYYVMQVPMYVPKHYVGAKPYIFVVVENQLLYALRHPKELLFHTNPTQPGRKTKFVPKLVFRSPV